MAIVDIKNKELYKQWLDYFDRNRPEMKPFEKRAYAFLNSNNGESPPKM